MIKKEMVVVMSLVLALMCLVGCGGGDAPAADGENTLNFPTEAVNCIVPYSAGGGTDLMSRAVADELAKRLGVSVVVDDKPGGSGSIGMQLLAASKNDGYTLILTACGACTLSPWLNDVTYTDESFAPICQVSASPSFICVRKDSGITTFDELVEKAKAAL